jgi:hypothetical protein
MTTITVTHSSANAYLIDGQSNPSITLTRGNTYYLVINANGHPFWIQSVSGQYDSNNIYNSGVTYNGAQYDTITFVVPSNAPNTLYYVCQFHSVMQGTINIINKATVCLTSPSIVNIISSNGNKYVFNNGITYDSNVVYGLVNGAYVFKNISSSHPMALLNNGKTSSITYSGDISKKLTTSVEGVSYDFYYGDITVQVNGNFGTISVYCYYHGYMGGQDLLKYSVYCIPPLDTSVINGIEQGVPTTVDTNVPVIVVNVSDNLLTSGTETVKSQKRTIFLEKLFSSNGGLASASGKIIMSRDKLLGTNNSVITNNTMVIKKASNTEVALNISQLAANESIYVFMNNQDYTVFNTSAGKLKIIKTSEILYTIYENYVDINSPVTKTMNVGESSSVGNFVYVLGGVSGQLLNTPSAQNFLMRSLFTNNSQVFYKPNTLSTGSGGSGVRNYRIKQRRT